MPIFVLVNHLKKLIMKTKQIKSALINGENFGNEAANWYSVCKPSQNIYWIVIGEKNFFFNNIDSVSKKIAQLIKIGN
jgi:hypothetical protein